MYLEQEYAKTEGGLGTRDDGTPVGEPRQTQHRRKHKRRNPCRVKQERNWKHKSTTQEKHESFARLSVHYSAMHITNNYKPLRKHVLPRHKRR